MADENIKKAFIDGIYDIYSALFTDGMNDGVYFYQLQEPEDKGIYREVKYKKYTPPKLLVGKVSISPTQGENDVEALKQVANITIPYKSLRDNGIDTSLSNLFHLRKGIMKYKDTFFAIDTIKPKIYVSDTYMAYEFNCTEMSDKEVSIYTPPIDETPSVSVEEEVI